MSPLRFLRAVVGLSAIMLLFALALTELPWEDFPPELRDRLAGVVVPTPTPAPTRTPAPAQGLAAGMAASLVRSDGPRAGATVVAAWLTRDYLRDTPGAAWSVDPERYLVFRVAVDAPALARASASDLKGMVFLRDGAGKEYGTPLWVSIWDRPFMAGVAGFPRRDARDRPVPALGSPNLELVLRGLPGPVERALRWELDGALNPR